MTNDSQAINSRPLQRLPGLHGLRALAALGVVAFHTALVPNPALSLPFFFNVLVPVCGIGVVLFFVLSAFSLLYSHDHRPTGKHWVIIYLIKRTFRIGPLFWLMTIEYLISPYHSSDLTLHQFIANCLFYFNFVPDMSPSIVAAGWTVGVEMPFYLLLPALIILFQYRGKWARVDVLVLTIAAIVVSAYYETWASRHGASGTADMSFFTNAFIFLAGASTYYFVKDYGTSSRTWSIVGLAGLALITPLAFDRDVLSAIPGRPHLVTWTLGFCAICASQAARPAAWLGSRPMQWLGERSYSIYLLHPFIIFHLITYHVYEKIYAHLRPLGNWAYLACFGLTISLVLLFAVVTYAVIELPGQRLGNRVIQHLLSGKVTIRRPTKINAQKQAT